MGALDVAPVVYLDESSRGAAYAQALVIADRIGHELQIPVFLYGELAGGRTRAQLRSGGVGGLAERIATGELAPDFGPARLHPTAGATLVGARPPLVAFNLQLAPPASVADARRIAALIREGGPEGLPGVRAIGVRLAGEMAQVSMNVERPFEVPLALVLERVRAHAPGGERGASRARAARRVRGLSRGRLHARVRSVHAPARVGARPALRHRARRVRIVSTARCAPPAGSPCAAITASARRYRVKRVAGRARAVGLR